MSVIMYTAYSRYFVELANAATGRSAFALLRPVVAVVFYLTVIVMTVLDVMAPLVASIPVPVTVAV
jgi:hypothetical protein